MRRTWKIPLAERNLDVPGHSQGAFEHVAADGFVGSPEGHSGSHHLLRGIRREKGWVAGGAGQPFAIEFEMLDQQRRRDQGIEGVVDCGEQRGLVLLQIAVVSEG